MLGACGAWPEPGSACSGFLVEHDGFRLVLDLGYATMPRLPVYALPGALDAVLALDRPGMLDDAYVLPELTPGLPFAVGPFAASARLLPHWVANAGIR